MSFVIETEGLTKVYEGALSSQDVLALNDLTIQVKEGEIFGYLGPNGSGKTTTIKMLLGLLFPTSGSMKLMGRSDITSPEVRRKIGYLPEGAYYPDFLTGEEVLSFFGNLYGMGGKELKSRIAETLEIVGMTRARNRRVRGYSKGMRQRIGLAQALLSDPQLLILDEPTTGLDPVARKDIRDLLMKLRDEGKTLFISSHELLEVELISDRVGILFEGDLQTIGTIDELLAERDMAIVVENSTPESLAKLAESDIKVDDSIKNKTVLRIPTDTSLFDAIKKCEAVGVNLVSVAPRRETLEELFVRIVGTAQKEKETAQGKEE